jgi:hypothetical protein
MRAFDEARPGLGGGQPYSSIVNVDALAAGTQLLSLKLPFCTRLTSLTALRGMVNLHSLNIDSCSSVSDLTPLASMENLQSLNVSHCSSVSDLAPLAAMGMVNLKIMWNLKNFTK